MDGHIVLSGVTKAFGENVVVDMTVTPWTYEPDAVIEVGDMIWQRQLFTLRHALLRNLEQVLGANVVTDLDFRPMPPRRKPVREESPRPKHGIADPVMSLLYTQSLKKQA